MEATAEEEHAHTHAPRRAPAWDPSSVRWVAVALFTCALALFAYGLVDWTGTFEIERIEVSGAPPQVARAVEQALEELAGENLVSLSAHEARVLAKQVPQVLALTVDRDFPNTLRVRLVLHEPVAVVRSGAEAWVVSRRGRVLEAIKPAAQPSLPRVWIPAGSLYERGEVLRSSAALAATRALARLPQSFPLPVVSARGSVDDLSVIVGGSTGRLELRLGEAESLRLKLGVAAQVLRSLAPGEAKQLEYLDVSVAERPVAAAARLSPKP